MITYFKLLLLKLALQNIRIYLVFYTLPLHFGFILVECHPKWTGVPNAIDMTEQTHEQTHLIYSTPLF